MSNFKSKRDWGDDDDEEREEQKLSGISTIERTAIRTNSKGEKVKTITTVRVREFKLLVPKRVEMRKNLPRFGNAKIGEENITNYSKEYITFEHPMDVIEAQEKDKTLVNMIGSRMAESKELREKNEEIERENSFNEDAKATNSNVYVPPSKRAGATESENSECTIRVSNLTKDVKEADIRELFERFGKLGRVSLPHMERQENGKTIKEIKGSAFVEFKWREDAEKAMERLQGHPYGHLILRLEWAKPSKNVNVGSMSGLEGRHTSGYGEKLAQDTQDKNVIFTSHGNR